MLTKAKRELLDAGFIFETVKGQRPNKVARYAGTWRALDRHPGYEAGTAEAFQRGAYRLQDPVQIAPPAPPHGTEKNASLVPSHGPIDGHIAPPHGPIRGVFGAPSVLPHGHLSREPSTAQRSGDVQTVEGVHERVAHIEQDDDAASSRREAAPRPTRPRRRPKGPGLDDAQHVPQPPDPTAQLELLLNRQG